MNSTKHASGPGTISSHSHRPRRRGVPAIPLGLTVLVLAVCALGGGSARVDAASLLYLRPLAALVVAALMFVPIRDASATRWPMRWLALWAGTIVLQLVPLPPAVWAGLPGHAQFLPLAQLADVGEPWRAVSLAPMLTWNALLALVPAWAGLLAASRLSHRDLGRVPLMLLSVAGASMLLGALQIASGRGYLYAVTSPGLPVGLFANRNHQAAFLAATLPLIAVSAWPQGARPWDRARPWLALGGGLVTIVFLLVTGSRAGLGLAAAGIVAAALLAPPLSPASLGRKRRGREGGSRDRAGASRLLRLLPVALAGLAVLLAVTLGRSLATERLLTSTGASTEQRAQALPTLLAMTRDFLPFGSGFGTFDPLFRVYEPDALLHRSVFNHAHNDLIEVALTGGAFALVVVAGFLIWFAIRVIAVRVRGPGVGTSQRRIAIAAAVSLAILLAASLVDYPLRTPLLTLVFVLLAGIVARGTEAGVAGSTGDARLVAADPRG